MKSYTQMKFIQDFNKKALLSALLAAGMVMGSASVSALTATGAMTVSATLTSSCSVSDSAIAFGSIAALDVTADVLADTGTTLQIACTTGTTAPVIYSTTTRTMTGAGSLPFFLSQVVGAPTNALPVAPAGEAIAAPWTANGVAQTVVIYGRIPSASFAGQPVGSYSATITISVDYT
jgi:spore coat protein U-like protein